MKYIFLTLQYLFRLDSGKRFITLLLFALPPCLVLAYYFPITGYFEWFFNYKGDYASYSALWLSLVERSSLKLGFLFLGYTLLIMSIAAITTLVIRSVRIGKFQVKSLFYLINENFFPAFYMITLFIVSLFIFQSLICLFLFLWQFLPGFVMGYIFSIIFTLLGLFFATWGYSSLFLWLPIMSINGQKPFTAIGSSFSKNHNSKSSVLLAYIIIIVCLLLLGLVSFIFKKIWYLSWIITTINYALATVFFIVLNILAYFEIESITREDLIKRPYLRR